jgi:uncharacterized protein DUF4301
MRDKTAKAGLAPNLSGNVSSRIPPGGCMPAYPFSPRDQDQMRLLGIDPQKALSELDRFQAGQSYAGLERACGPGDGIHSLSPQDRNALAESYRKARETGRAMQFVPASGAATRMFKALLSIRHRGDAPDLTDLVREGRQGNPTVLEFLAWFQGLDSFPFRDRLERCLAERGKDLGALIENREYRPILDALLDAQGLGYAEMPKALIPFHAYGNATRMAFEEHLVEAKSLVRDREGVCRLHFTVSPGHADAFRRSLAEALAKHESDGTRFSIGISIQDPSTDTLAADPEGRPFRDRDGKLVFRPGGHGALLENLAHCGGDLVFIKNIDNIVPDAMRPEITEWRLAMGGLLAETQSVVFRHLAAIKGSDEGRALSEAAHFAQDMLGIRLPPGMLPLNGTGSREAARRYLMGIFDRPIRVCAMVENRGEPGGGPFWVRHRDGSSRIQIVEMQQVDFRSSDQAAIAEGSAFFNPTDLACGLLDSHGRPFDLARFADPEAGFITMKSRDGRDLMALELPGLWNGSMADWNSVFVEAPAEIFNPVKSVVDLLRHGRVKA